MFTETGSGTVTGLWLFTASAFDMKKTLVATAEQLRNVFYDVTVTKTGAVLMGTFIDGKQVGQNEGTLFTAKDVGKMYPFMFYYPYRYRKLGTHKVEVKLGKMTQETVLFIFKRAIPVWEQTFRFDITCTSEEEM